jgi:3-oxoacyl-[acyl-carrier-protein] synthase II
MTCDASHVSTPAADNRSARLAIEKCLEQGHLTPAAIQFIHAHGTGTRLNDQREAALIQDLFPPSVAVCSTKGATGHTLGASGAIGAAVCLMALAQQCLPPQVGLQHPEFDLNFVAQARPEKLTNVLCLSFGFGGQNVALSFRRQL